MLENPTPQEPARRALDGDRDAVAVTLEKELSMVKSILEAL